MYTACMHNILHIGLSASYYDVILIYKYLQSDVMYLSMIAKDKTLILLFEFVRRHRIIYIYITYVHGLYDFKVYLHSNTHTRARAYKKYCCYDVVFTFHKYFAFLRSTYFFSLHLSSDQTPSLHQWISLRNVLCI